ncbi:glutathione S-transferase family protein [Pelagibacterium lacus]|uniref:Glutathione S-transferase family protein n=1 Tax=Pelagibacterium lacus TaxID=2282655 RepID=A0A369W5Q3_9HYPH|nr:glutathione S-transferase family protein [Pelagibacterium lacus]RDE09673.1 glutathione S-transferase family protein [Pelagibacterium lacus]
MKLYYGGLSPFVRKVMVTAYELGVADRIEKAAEMVTPFKTNDAVAAANPLGKIPAARLEDGSVLYGSTVICEYLDATFGAGRIFSAGAARWTALRRAALGDGILEAGSLARIETLRPEGLQWEDWRLHQREKVARALSALEAEAGELGIEALTIGEITVGCALGWLDVRLPDLGWRDSSAALAKWFDTVSQRPSLVATEPVLPK